MYRTYRGPKAEHSDHDHEEMANTLMEAEAIKGDKAVMKHVQKKLSARGKAINSIAGLRDLAKVKEDGNDPDLKPQAKRTREMSDRQGMP